MKASKKGAPAQPPAAKRARSNGGPAVVEAVGKSAPSRSPPPPRRVLQEGARRGLRRALRLQAGGDRSPLAPAARGRSGAGPRLPARLVDAVRASGGRPARRRRRHRSRPAAARRSPGARVLVGDIFTTPATPSCWGRWRRSTWCCRTWRPTRPACAPTDQARSAALFEEALTRAERLLAPGARSSARSSRAPTSTGSASAWPRASPRCGLVKPEGSRAQSIEIYLAGKGFTASALLRRRARS